MGKYTNDAALAKSLVAAAAAAAPRRAATAVCADAATATAGERDNRRRPGRGGVPVEPAAVLADSDNRTRRGELRATTERDASGLDAARSTGLPHAAPADGRFGTN